MVVVAANIILEDIIHVGVAAGVAVPVVIIRDPLLHCHDS